MRCLICPYNWVFRHCHHTNNYFRDSATGGDRHDRMSMLMMLKLIWCDPSDIWSEAARCYNSTGGRKTRRCVGML